MEIIKYYHEIKEEKVCLSAGISITDHWLAGFVDGDASFTASKFGVRFKFENHIKELELLKKINEFIKTAPCPAPNLSGFGKGGILSITQPRNNRPDSNSTCILDINNIHVLKNVIIPIFKGKVETVKTGVTLTPNSNLLRSKKIKDFNDWCILVNIFYFGYHTIPEGVSVINEIRSRWNNFRLSTYKARGILNQQKPYDAHKACTRYEEMRLTVQTGFFDLPLDSFKRGQAAAEAEQGTLLKEQDINIDFENKLKYLFSLPAPYEIKNGVRVIRGTHKLVSERTQIYCVEAIGDNKLSRSQFSSISECSKALKIDRSTIKKYLITGDFFNNYKFSLTP